MNQVGEFMQEERVLDQELHLLALTLRRSGEFFSFFRDNSRGACRCPIEIWVFLEILAAMYPLRQSRSVAEESRGVKRGRKAIAPVGAAIPHSGKCVRENRRAPSRGPPVRLSGGEP